MIEAFIAAATRPAMESPRQQTGQSECQSWGMAIAWSGMRRMGLSSAGIKNVVLGLDNCRRLRQCSRIGRELHAERSHEVPNLNMDRNMDKRARVGSAEFIIHRPSTRAKWRRFRSAESRGPKKWLPPTWKQTRCYSRNRTLEAPMREDPIRFESRIRPLGSIACNETRTVRELAGT
jgi:hypothetical protein